jgi:TonB-linked SusC/RagA family outer membrane protein
MIQRNTNTFYSLLFLAALVLAPSASQAQVAESDSIDGVDEVVVVGYGTQKKSNVTGAISKVKSKDLQDVPLTRVEQALQGRTSGVQILQNSGQPGSSSVVRIRGTASINGSNPLYVVDGVVITGGIDYLNPNDIETIEVLKDAASAAIYGARGANGVIIVTTKSGKKGAMKVNVSMYRGTQNAWKTLPVLNATEYATLQNEMAAAAGQAPKFADPRSLGQGTDWQSKVFNPSAPMSNIEINLSGSTDKIQYYASISKYDQEGIVAAGKSNYNRLTARLNTIIQASNRLKFGWNAAYTNVQSMSVAENTEFGSPLGRALNIDPLTPLYETNPFLLSQNPYSIGGALRKNLMRDAGGIYGISSIVTSEIVNPVAALMTENNTGWSDKIVNNTYAEYEIIKGLKFKTSIGTDLAFYGGYGFRPSYYLNATNFLDTNFVYQNFNRALTWVWDNSISYSTKINKHNIDLVAGHSAQETTGTFIGGSKRDVPTQNPDDATINYARNANSRDVYGGKWERYAIESYFSRVNYNFNGKYLLTAILRADASSRFGSNYRWGYFPSISGGWNMHEESFWKPNKYIQTLKLKSGWGMSGNDAAGSLEYAATISGGRSYSFGSSETLTNGTSPTQVANPDLHWETVTQTNFGFESRIFKNINLGLDIYQKNTTGMMSRPVLPDYIGNDAPTSNVGTMVNKGIDIEANYSKILKNGLSVNIGGNISFVNNEVTLIGNQTGFLSGAKWGPQSLEISRITEGQAIGHFYGYKTDGIFQTIDEVNNYKNADGKLIQKDAVAGDLKFVDVNNDGVIDEKDRTIIGNPTPSFVYGLNISLKFKGFDLMIFGQGVEGNDIYNATRRYDLPNANMNAAAINRWTGAGSSNQYPRLTLQDNNNNFARSSDFYVEDGSFFRIKNFQIGYRIPDKILKKWNIAGMRIYYSASNLFTFTNYSGFDPEIGNGYGIDRGIYPQARMNSLGLSLNF